MLTKCPECALQISDKAHICPHCGCPLKGDPPRPYVRKKQHMRLPNGFGQISEIKGRKLRRPFRAMVTVGVTEHGRPICKILKPQGYFETYNEAYAALMQYNKEPYDIDMDITMGELYAKWSEEIFKSLRSPSTIRQITAAWAYCSKIENVRVKDVRIRHLKDTIETASIKDGASYKLASPNIKHRIKSTFNQMFDYALENEYTDKNYARMFAMSENINAEAEANRRSHMPFDEDEIEALWANVGKVPYVDAVLVQCYMGWRPQELGLIKISDVDMSARTIKGGIKTAAGKNRVVPIHHLILPLIQHRIETSKTEYLFDCNGFMTYDKYVFRFKDIVTKLNLNPEHRPHDGRNHFITMCKRYNVDEYAIKYMVGHAITDVTEHVYTKRDPEWLLHEVEKIKGPVTVVTSPV